MRRRRTPVNVEVPSASTGASYTERGARNVVLFEAWRPRPLFHGFALDASGKTMCALDAYYVDDRGRITQPRGAFLPLRHALAFGRPCRRCWP